jgi:hypothetical protein
MAVTRAKKKEQVEKLGADLQTVTSVIVATYTKQTVAWSMLNNLAWSCRRLRQIVT